MISAHPNNPEPSDADINNFKTKPGRAFVYSPTTDTVTEYDGNGPQKTRDVTDNKEFRFVK